MASCKLHVTRNCAAVVTDGAAVTKVTGNPRTRATVSRIRASIVIVS